MSNAAVYTLNKQQPWAEAFAYDSDGTIVAVGDEDAVLEAAGGQLSILDAGGRMVLPGFQDTHVHVPEAGINVDLCVVDPGGDLAFYLDAVAGCAEQQDDDNNANDWVLAVGASLFNLRQTDQNPLDLLDELVAHQPVLVLDDLGHAAWTNTLGLEAAGIGPDDPDPQGGILHRDADGRLTGLLLEDAQQLVRNAAAPDEDAIYNGLLVALGTLAQNGITTVSDAGGYWGQKHPAAWQRALDEGTLTVRGINTLYVYPDLDANSQLAEFERRFSDDPDSLLRYNTAKIYIDGILDLGTAALTEPYLDPIDPDRPSGFYYFESAQLNDYVNRLQQLGYRIEFHVIGDAATRAALDAVEAIDDTPEKIADRRHRTTHTYLVHPDDLARFATIGVVADFQVGPDSTAVEYHEFLAAYIGVQAFDLIPVDSALDSGASVSLSSDWDADPLSPLGTIERALTRQTHAVGDIETAIALVTLNAAYALGHDDQTGSIEIGKQADFVVLGQNLLEIPVSQIDETEVLLTVLGGNETYRSPSFN